MRRFTPALVFTLSATSLAAAPPPKVAHLAEKNAAIASIDALVDLIVEFHGRTAHAAFDP